MHLIFDANLPRNLSKGLAKLEEGNKKSPNPAIVGHVYDHMAENATDEEIIITAGQKEWIVITQDLGFGRIEHEFILLKQHKVSVVFFKPPKKGFCYWDMVKTFIEKWEELKEHIKLGDGHCALLIEKTGGIKPLDIVK